MSVSTTLQNAKIELLQLFTKVPVVFRDQCCEITCSKQLQAFMLFYYSHPKEIEIHPRGVMLAPLFLYTRDITSLYLAHSCLGNVYR